MNRKANGDEKRPQESPTGSRRRKSGLAKRRRIRKEGLTDEYFAQYDQPNVSFRNTNVFVDDDEDEVQPIGTAADREFMTQVRDEIAEQLMQIYSSSLQTLKNKQSSSCRLQTFGPPLLLQRLADVVRRLQMFWFRKNKRRLRLGLLKLDMSLF
ncbi:hypothetical protein LXL04_038967 [Taraxacum kok-saghyz]